MYTNTNKYKAIVLLLPLILAMRVDVYGQFREAGQPEGRTTGEPAFRLSSFPVLMPYALSSKLYAPDPMPSAETNSMYRWLRQLMSPLLGAGHSIAASGIKHQERRLPSSEFGREDPFMPLIVEHAAGSTVKPDSPESRRAGKPDGRKTGLLNVRLTAIFVGDASYAIIEEDGISRSVYVGDVVAGMSVMEIRRAEITLGKGDKRCTVTLGGIARSNSQAQIKTTRGILDF